MKVPSTVQRLPNMKEILYFFPRIFSQCISTTHIFPPGKNSNIFFLNVPFSFLIPLGAVDYF